MMENEIKSIVSACIGVFLIVVFSILGNITTYQGCIPENSYLMFSGICCEISFLMIMLGCVLIGYAIGLPLKKSA